jgi:hypothetical protein
MMQPLILAGADYKMETLHHHIHPPNSQAFPPLDFFALTLSHLLNKLIGTVTPVATMVIAKATLTPQAYARTTPSSAAPENTSCTSVAPVAMTRAESTLGAVLESLRTSWLTKLDCAAAIRKVPPMPRKTRKGSVNVYVSSNRHPNQREFVDLL